MKSFGNTINLEVNTLKEKNTGLLYKVLVFDAHKNQVTFTSEYREIVDFFLPVRYTPFIRFAASDFSIYDRKEDKFIEVSLNKSIMLKSENDEIIVTTDFDWFYDNFEVADPVLNFISKEEPTLDDIHLLTAEFNSDDSIYYEKYKKIFECLRSFNFYSASEVFKKMNYVWGGLDKGQSTRVPTENEIFCAEAKRVIEEFFYQKKYFAENGDYEAHSTFCGRFEVVVHSWVNEDDTKDFRISLKLVAINSF